MPWYSKLRDRIAGLIFRDQIAARCTRAYFEVVYPEYQLLQRPSPTKESIDGAPGSQAIPAEWAIADELVTKFRTAPHSLTMTDSLLFERVVLRLLPEANLRRKAPHLRERYRELVGKDEYQSYLGTKPPDAATAPIAELRADLEEVLVRFQGVYATVPFREEVRNTLSIKIVSRLLALMVLAAVIYTVNHTNESTERFPSILVVVFTGAVGGFLSVQQRIQSAPTNGDAIRGVLSLSNGWFSVYFSPIMGAVFAMLLYILFIGEFLKGNLFPEIVCVGVDGKPPVSPDFELFVRSCGPKASADYAKLIIWAFLAGFAERMVPDTLNRMAESVRSKTSASSQPENDSNSPLK